MLLHSDLSAPITVRGAKLDWIASPIRGVRQRMLFRVGGEIARATSIVQYAPGSVFPRHLNGGGEEILVLDGVFQDERGDYPAGSYLRNPPGGVAHESGAAEGCTIFVRQWQSRSDDDALIVRYPGEGETSPPRPGATTATVLFRDPHEQVRVEEWEAGAQVSVENPRGLEFFILSGTLRVNDEVLETHSWGRFPSGVALLALIGPIGAKIWLKDALLRHPRISPLPPSALQLAPRTDAPCKAERD